MLSKIVPRPAGRTIGAFVCVCASAESDDARTVAIHEARASSAANTTRTQRSNSRMREFTTRAIPPLLLPRELEVARVCCRGRDKAEPARCLLDSLRGGSARDLGRQSRILRLKFELLAVEPAHAHVHAQHGHVERDDPGEDEREQRDPRDPAAEPALRPDARTRNGTRADARRYGSRNGVVHEPVERRHQVFTAARRRADAARGFAATSASLGRIGRRCTARTSGSCPHTHTGKSGGHVQPRSLSRMKCLTMRSSSEWNEITASRPPGRSSSSAAGSANPRDSSSSFTAMRSAWKTRFAGCPSPKRAGAGIELLITSTSSPVRSNGRWRTIARAICLAYRSSPYRRKMSVRSRSVHVLTISLASRSCEVSMRMSSGASTEYEKPRSGRSSCIDETPRSSRIASTCTSFPASCGSTTAKSPRSKRVCTVEKRFAKRSKYA